MHSYWIHTPNKADIQKLERFVDSCNKKVQGGGNKVVDITTHPPDEYSNHETYVVMIDVDEWYKNNDIANILSDDASIQD